SPPHAVRHLLQRDSTPWGGGHKSQKPRRKSPRHHLRARPGLEPPETRCLLTAYIVTNTGDAGVMDPLFNDPTMGDLRYCIPQANADPSVTIQLGFATGMYGPQHNIPGGFVGNGTISLASALPDITAMMTISTFVADGTPTSWTIQRTSAPGAPGAPPTPDFA